MPEIVIRRVRPADAQGLAEFYASLSPESLRARFLGYTQGISGTASRSFCSLDHMHDEGFVALDTDIPGDRVVGHVCLASVGPTQLELGIAVADSYQGRAIGRRLFEAALSWARERHFKSVVATCFADNSRVLALLTSAPLALVEAASSGVVDVVIPLERPLPKAVSTYVGPDGRSLLSRGRRSGRRNVSPLSHGASRRTPPPGHGVAS